MKSLVAAIVQFFYRLRHGITVSNLPFEANVAAVNGLADDTSALSDSQLRERFETLRQLMTNGTAPNDLSVQAFAMIREAAGRTLSMRPYDVQMLAAFAMHDGKCVEMQTGEGKTLAAAEIREGIHLVSFGGFNAYDVFNKEMNLEFNSFLSHVEEKVAETMRTATFSKDGINLETEGLNAPSSTWTFMINDNPRGSVLNRIIQSLKGRLKKSNPDAEGG